MHCNFLAGFVLIEFKGRYGLISTADTTKISEYEKDILTGIIQVTISLQAMLYCAYTVGYIFYWIQENIWIDINDGYHKYSNKYEKDLFDWDPGRASYYINKRQYCQYLSKIDESTSKNMPKANYHYDAFMCYNEKKTNNVTRGK